VRNRHLESTHHRSPGPSNSPRGAAGIANRLLKRVDYAEVMGDRAIDDKTAPRAPDAGVSGLRKLSQSTATTGIVIEVWRRRWGVGTISVK